MLDIEEFDEDAEDEVLPEDELTIGGGFEDFPFRLFDFVDELPASFSCTVGCGVFRRSFGEVWGLWIFSPRVSVKLLLSAWIDDSARLKSLS